MVIAWAVPVGLLIGLALGALGGGGSILTVPALVYLLGQGPRAATTGSLLIVGVTAVAGMVAHWKAGRVRVAQGLVFGVLGVVGSYFGSKLSARVDPDVLLTAFAVLMLVAAGAMLRRVRRSRAGSTVDAAARRRRPDPGGGRPHAGPVEGAQRPGPAAPAAGGTDARVDEPRRLAVLDPGDAEAEQCRLPSPTVRFTTCRALKVLAAATVVGLLTGFFGVGGGFVIVPALVLALGFDMPVAVGTSLLVIAINAAAALVVRLGGHPQLDWPVLGLFTLTAIAGSVLGNRVASKVDAAKLTVAFTALLVVIAVYVASQSVPHLL